MTSIQQRLSTGRGKFTTDYPELGTAPVDYEDSTLPQPFFDLEFLLSDWAFATRAQRYEARLSKPFDELVAFYDAVAPRPEPAV